MSENLSAYNEYNSWFAEIKKLILQTQQRAALKVNQELLYLYWNIGSALATKQTQWGDKFIESLAKDLKVEFPEMKGFSKSNLKYMRRWFFYHTTHFESLKY